MKKMFRDKAFGMLRFKGQKEKNQKNKFEKVKKNRRK